MLLTKKTFWTLLASVAAVHAGDTLTTATAVLDPAISTLQAGLAVADSTAKAASEQAAFGLFTANNIWMLVATFLVFSMHLGFASIESGLTRSKNTVNVLFKNVAIVAIGIITYYLVGFKLMYPGEDFAKGFIGWAGGGLGIDPGKDYSPIAYAGGAYTYWTDFIFQGMFAATAATIISGAVAERIKLGPFLFFAALYVAFVYPIIGMWKWGGGWLDALGFYDFAGSTLVHSVGGWGALAAVILLGPRIGKYVGKTVRPIMGHNMPLATIGMFLLWFGWFGFNGGSVLSGDPELVSLVFVTTTLAAAAGLLSSMATSWIVSAKPDLSMVLNGTLAGLVGITAGADVISPLNSIIVGAIAGVLVVFSVFFFDKIKMDDPVGALSVHLVCGVWGTLAVGIFGAEKEFLPQLIGVLAIGAASFISAMIIMGAIKAVFGIRVSREEELQGLDIGEHHAEAYAGFQIFTSN